MPETIMKRGNISITTSMPICQDTSVRQMEEYMDFYKGFSLDNIKSLGTYEEQGRALYDYIIERLVENDNKRAKEAFSYASGFDNEIFDMFGFGNLFYTYLKTDENAEPLSLEINGKPDYMTVYTKDKAEKHCRKKNQSIEQISDVRVLEKFFENDIQEEQKKKYGLTGELFEKARKKSIERGIDFLAEGKKKDSDRAFRWNRTDFASVKSDEEYKIILGRKKRKFIETATKHLKDYDMKKASEMLGYVDLKAEKILERKPSRKAFVDAYMGRKKEYAESDIVCMHSCMLRNGMIKKGGSKRLMIKIAHDLTGKKNLLSKENGKAILDYVTKKYKITDLLYDKDYRRVFMKKSPKSRTISVDPDGRIASKKIQKEKNGKPGSNPELNLDIIESTLKKLDEKEGGKKSNSSVNLKISDADERALQKIINDYPEPNFLKGERDMKQGWEIKEKIIEQDWEAFWSSFPDKLENYINDYPWAKGIYNSEKKTGISGRPQNFAKDVHDTKKRVTLDLETGRTVPVDENDEMEAAESSPAGNIKTWHSIHGERPTEKFRDR